MHSLVIKKTLRKDQDCLAEDYAIENRKHAIFYEKRKTFKEKSTGGEH